MPLQSIDFGTLQPNDGDTLFEAFTKVNSNSIETQTAIDSISNLVPYTGATSNINLGTKTITATSIIKLGGNSSQFLKADGTTEEGDLNLKADLINGTVPAYQLPSYVDDVLEVTNFTSLPVTGEIGKIYVALNNNKMYRWTGSIYIEIASNSAIWGSITGTLSNQTDLQNALNLKANDNTVVHLTGTEIITGTKTFVLSPYLEAGTFLKQVTSFSIANGYTSLNGLANGIQISVSDYKNVQLNMTNLTSLKTFEFPNTSGTLALTSDLHNALTIGVGNGLNFTTIAGIPQQIINLSLSGALTTGALSSTDWNTFNNKLTLPTLTSGSVLFSNGTTIAQDNSQFFWDNTNKRLGIGTITPVGKINVFTGLTGITEDIINQQLGSISFANGGSVTAAPSISGKSNNNLGLSLLAATNDTNVEEDLGFNVRRNNNTDFTTLTSCAFRFSRFDQPLFDILRNGDTGIGTTTIGSKLQVNGNTALGYNASTIAPLNGLAVSGDVGIGTITPNFAAVNRKVLDVNGVSTTVIALSIGGVQKGYLLQDANNLTISNRASTGGLLFYTSDVLRLTIASNGVATFSSLAGTGTRTVVASSTGVLSTSTTSNPNYKVFTAQISQSGTSVPTVTILENTLGGTVVWSRTLAGRYLGTLTGAFTLLKTVVFYQSGSDSGGIASTGFTYNSYVDSVNAVRINSMSNGVYTDTILGGQIEIRVYN